MKNYTKMVDQNSDSSDNGLDSRHGDIDQMCSVSSRAAPTSVNYCPAMAESPPVASRNSCQTMFWRKSGRLKTWMLVILGIIASSGHGPPTVHAGRRFAARSLQRSPMYGRDINRDQFTQRWLALSNDYNSVQPTIRPSAYLEPTPMPPPATTQQPSYQYYQQDQNVHDLPRPLFDTPANYNQQHNPGNSYHHQQSWPSSGGSQKWEQFTVNANNLPPAISPVYPRPSPTQTAGGQPGFVEVNQLPEPFTPYTDTKYQASQNNPQQSGMMSYSHQQHPVQENPISSGSNNGKDRYKVIVNVKPAYERFYIGSHVNPLNVRRKEKSLLVLNFVEANNGGIQQQQWRIPQEDISEMQQPVRREDNLHQQQQHPQQSSNYPQSQPSNTPMNTRQAILEWLKGPASNPGQNLQTVASYSKPSNRVSKYFDGGELQLKNTLKDSASMSAPVVYDFARPPTTPSTFLASVMTTPEPPSNRFQVTPESATALIGKPPFGTIINNLPSFAGFHQESAPQNDQMSATTAVPSPTPRPYGTFDETAGRYDKNNFQPSKINANRYTSDFPSPIANIRPQQHQRTTTTTTRPWPTENLQYIKTSPTAGYAAAPKVPTFVSYNGSPMPSQHQVQHQTVQSSYTAPAFGPTTTPAPSFGHYGSSGGSNQVVTSGAGYHGDKYPISQAQVQPHAVLSFAQPYLVKNYEPDRLSDVVDSYKPPTSTISSYQPYRERTTTSTARPWPEQIWSRPKKVFYFGKPDNNKRRGMAMGQFFQKDYANQMLEQMEAAQPQQGVSIGVGVAGSHLAPSAWAKAYLQHAVAAGELTQHGLRLPRPTFAHHGSTDNHGSGSNQYQQRVHAPSKILTRAEVMVETTVSPWVYENVHKPPVSQEWSSRKLQTFGLALPEASSSLHSFTSQHTHRMDSGRAFSSNNKPVQQQQQQQQQEQQQQKPAGAVQYFTSVTRFSTIKNSTDADSSAADNPRGFTFSKGESSALEDYISMLDDDVKVNLVDLIPKRKKSL